MRTETIRDNPIPCSCCGETFSTEYYSEGSIQHNNVLSNMRVVVNRFKEEKHRQFLFIIGLDDNYCNIKDNTYSAGVATYECALMWLDKEGYSEIHAYMKRKEPDIAKEYNKIKKITIGKAEKKLNKLRGELLNEN